MWRNGTPHTLLVGTYSDAAALEKRLAVPHKVRQFPCDPAVPLLGLYPRYLKTC